MSIEALAATSTEASRARAILEKKITDGAVSARGLFERIHAQAPLDQIAKVDALTFQATEAEGGFEVKVGDDFKSVHRHALGQIAGRADVPPSYLSDLVNGKPWQRDMAAGILNRSFDMGHPGERALIRSVQGQVRGFLSDRYRRLDSRPLFEAFAGKCQEFGALPIEGTVSDVRVAMKALLPIVFEPIAGEALCLGVEWGNSDFGAARHSVRAFIYRLWCLNGATMEDSLSQVHLGGRLGDDIVYSQKTYELDTATSVSALKDIVTNVLSENKVRAQLEAIKVANEKKVDWKKLRTTLAKKLLASEVKAVEQSFNSEDVYNLPAGPSAWRASNAISWIAGQTADADRKLDLQRLAGEVINGKADKYSEAA